MNKELSALLSSSISGLCEVSLTHSFDNIKTLTQYNAQKNINKRTIDIIKSIYKKNGFKGFYKGFIPRLTGIIPMRTIFWSTQFYSTEFLIEKKINKTYASIIGGVVAGLIQSIIDTPIEVLKIRQMINKKKNYYNLKTLYSGFYPTLYRNIIFAICVNSLILYKEENNIIKNLTLPAIGGLIGSIISQPIDFIKTEIQRHHSDIYYIKKLIKENPMILMRGWYFRALFSSLNMGIGGVVFIQLNYYFLSL